jgi:hypothetical protein
MRLNPARGFIFVTVLIILQMLSLNSLYVLMHAATIMKKNTHRWQSQQTEWFAYKLMNQLEANIEASSQVCDIPVMSAVDFSSQALSWWEANTCSDNRNEIRYYYAVEPLGEDACGVINHHVASYKRITLNIPNQYLLQSTVAVPVISTAACQDHPHIVRAGRQMIRIL